MIINHKRVQVDGKNPSALCGATEWISLIRINQFVDCKKCLEEMAARALRGETMMEDSFTRSQIIRKLHRLKKSVTKELAKTCPEESKTCCSCLSLIKGIDESIADFQLEEPNGTR